MSTTEKPPLALKLADDLVFLTKTEWTINVFISKSKLETVAAELRRLHAENEALRSALQEMADFYYKASEYQALARAALARTSEAIGEKK